MYRNCVYSNRERKIHLWTWDSQGNRIKEEHDFWPYILLEDKSGTEKSIYGTTLKRKHFSSNFDRTKFVKESGIKRVFENLPPYQQFLVDEFWHSCENEEFSQFPLKTCFLDIECPSAEGFPEPETATVPINLLTVYDSMEKQYTMFGLKPFHIEREDVVFHYCKTEKELLKKFIGHFSNDFPDVLVGYNSAGFDVPYLINRINRELGEDWSSELSPVGRIFKRINPTGKFGMPTEEYVIEGISCLDYMVMYQKFSMEKQESNKLDYIGEVELGINKVEYEGTLWNLSENRWDTYCEYNLRDVELIVKLDEKLDYISLLRFLAYTGLCSLENAIKTVPCMNGAIAIKARERGECIPTFIKPVSDYRAPGGYVAEPKPGFSSNIVSFDANSLYPSVMISLNLSPETKLGKVEKVGDMVKIHHVSGRVYDLTRENFGKYLKAENAAISKSDHIFSQKKKGIVPEFLDNLYTKRKVMKAKMLEARSMGNKKDEQKFDTIQYAYKIHLNSLYGYMLNKYAPMGDEDIGTSVTLTGQAAVKQSMNIFLQYLQEERGFDLSQAMNAIVYGDTDSNYFSLKCLEERGIFLQGENGISKEFYDECNRIEKYINDGMTAWAKKYLRSADSRFVFKREAICDAGIFIGKKYYVLHMLDDEGYPTDKFKYKGVDVVKTTMPKAIKPYVKKVIETMIMTQDKQKTNKVFNDAYEIFKGLSIFDVSKNSGINNFEKYSSKCSGLQTVKGMPAHVKAAYFHDFIMDRHGWASKYEKFKSGDKVRSVYVKTPNKYNISNIGFKGTYPEEFNQIFKVDYELMFNKIFYAAIERFYSVVGWYLRKPNESLKVEIEDILG